MQSQCGGEVNKYLCLGHWNSIRFVPQRVNFKVDFSQTVYNMYLDFYPIKELFVNTVRTPPLLNFPYMICCYCAVSLFFFCILFSNGLRKMYS